MDNCGLDYFLALLSIYVYREYFFIFFILYVLIVIQLYE